jgi:peptidoglycan-N-acetylglucosamine deacetylase
MGTRIVFILYIFACTIVSGQYDDIRDPGTEGAFQWPEGKKMAISLTFDDARESQVDRGIPLLNKHGVRATFYVSPGSLIHRVESWKMAVEAGHDIGNHSVHHPCSGNFPWAREHALEDYSLEKMGKELDSASQLIRHVLGIKPVSFAYPCGQTFVGRGLQTRSYVPLVAARFLTGRTWLDEAPNDPSYCDFAQLTGMELDGRPFSEIKTLIDDARQKGFWLILAGHETDTGGAQTSLLSTIDSICHYANDPANGIWIDHVDNVAKYVKEMRVIPSPHTGLSRTSPGTYSPYRNSSRRAEAAAGKERMEIARLIFSVCSYGPIGIPP